MFVSDGEALLRHKSANLELRDLSATCVTETRKFRCIPLVSLLSHGMVVAGLDNRGWKGAAMLKYAKYAMTGVALGAAVFAVTAASAADLPARPMYTKAAPAVELYNWTGFYIGANVGYSSGHSDFFGFGGLDPKGVVGGGQLGYNWQAPGSPWIFGFEVDGQGTGQDDTLTVPGASVTESLPWFFTARGRIGYAVTPTVMIYGTGGAAIVDHKLSATVGALTASTEESRLGWTAGAGIEGAFNRAWSWKVEYLHLDTNSENIAGLGTIHVTDEIGRVGINYHFGANPF
jgi:outer membrane immunogenic protein